MLRPLERRSDGYELFEVTSLDDLDFGAFLPMVDRAWNLDYADQPRLDIDQAFLRKLARGPWWVAVLAVAGDGEPVGFELALERTLRVRGRDLRAYYASVFTVAADHRRRGLGRFVLEGINRLVFEERRADLILSTFHEGHAGSPVVQSTFDRIPGWGVVRFHASPIWSRRLDREPLPPLHPAPVFVGLEAAGEGPAPELEARAASARAAATPTVPDAAAVDALLRADFDVSFRLSESLAAQYLSPSDESSGLLCYDLGPGRTCVAGYNLVPMAIDQRRLRPIGQLQLLLAPQASSTEIERVVHHMGRFLAERDCFAMTLLDVGVVPQPVLDRLGFVATDTRIHFAARGPLATLEAFAGVRPPFFLDFT